MRRVGYANWRQSRGIVTRLTGNVGRWSVVVVAQPRITDRAEDAQGVLRDDGHVTGVEATDRVAGKTVSFHAATVINCAGPWSPEVARRLDTDGDERTAGRSDPLFRRSLAFNLLFEKPPPSSVAVAVSGPEPGSHTWFLYPRRGYTYAGTAHFPCAPDATSPTPSPEQIDEAIEGMNAATPGLQLHRDQVVRVHAGFLPTTATGSADLADRPVFLDHGATGGPTGLWSVSGVKYTTARDVAEATLRRAMPTLPPRGEYTDRPEPATLPDLRSAAADPRGAAADDLNRFRDSEAVMTVDDLLLRRGPWGDDPQLLDEIRDAIADILVRGS